MQVASGKHVVFGKVIRGYDDVVKRISEVPVDPRDRPKVPVAISNCGELQLRKKQDDASQSEHYIITTSVLAKLAEFDCQ
jgi:peptidyl-prolyl isomerase G (cyclophilin G)